MTSVFDAVVQTSGAVLVAYFFVANGIYLLMMLIAFGYRRHGSFLRYMSDSRDRFSELSDHGVSVIIPAHDEEEVIVESVRSALAMRYPRLEVVVVDDGSRDQTFAHLVAAFDLAEVPLPPTPTPQVRGTIQSLHVARGNSTLLVVRKESIGTRSDALNAGIAVARHGLVCMLDADSILAFDALLLAATPFIDDPEHVVATGGSIRPANGLKVQQGQVIQRGLTDSFLPRVQILEYLRSFVLGRLGWSVVGATVLISGAFGVYRRQDIIDLGGLDADSTAEDLDLVLRLHRLHFERGTQHRVIFVPDALCWTEVPASRSVLARQRRRWSAGLAKTLLAHRSMVGNRRYGRVGLIGLPYYLLFELLSAPIEAAGLAVLGLSLAGYGGGTSYVFWYFLSAVVFNMVVSAAAVVIDDASSDQPWRLRETLRLVLSSVPENFGYRQLHLWWRLRGLFDVIARRTPVWGDMQRGGFDVAEANPESSALGAQT